MATTQTGSARAAASDTPDAASVLREKIRAHLERKRDQLCREISDYPPPRPACDVHFNRLLEERAIIFQELARLDALLSANLPRAQLDTCINEFVRSSLAVSDMETEP